MELNGKNILVVGIGKSGQAVARFAGARGAAVTMTDLCDEAALAVHIPELRQMGVDLVLGQHPIEIFQQADLIIVSPGVPHTIKPLELARNRNIPVIGELEFASRFIHEPVVAVTGTNGKTTTTSLLGEMLALSGKKVFVGGNIGKPLIEYVEENAGAETVVIEISSFQLDTTRTFRADVAVLLNISKDHLDRYDSFDAYVASKGRIFSNQTSENTAVINLMDPEVKKSAAACRAKIRPFFHAGRNIAAPESGAVIFEDEIIIHSNNGESVSLDLKQASLTGAHNRENIAAAALAALAAGATATGIQAAISSFRPLAHRLEAVDTINGVLYVNDSKGTNVDAVSRALDAISRPTVLIMGGRDKGSDYATLTKKLKKTVKQLVLMGEAAGAIEMQLGTTAPVLNAVDMAQAVKLAAAASGPGDVVLLSPACSSFDMYNSYSQRGEDFCKQVRELK